MRARPCLSKCEYFSVRSAGTKMIPLPDDAALANHQGSDHRIRAGRAMALCRKAKGQGHELKVLGSGGHRALRVTRPRRRFGFGFCFGFDFAFGLAFVGLARAALAGLLACFDSSSARAACAAANRAIATR